MNKQIIIDYKEYLEIDETIKNYKKQLDEYKRRNVKAQIFIQDKKELNKEELKKLKGILEGEDNEK